VLKNILLYCEATTSHSRSYVSYRAPNLGCMTRRSLLHRCVKRPENNNER